MGKSYDDLSKKFRRMDRLGHAASILGWDQAAMMPPGGARARGEAMAELQVMGHAMLADPELGAAIDAAQAEGLSENERASLREMRREWIFASALPDELVEAKSLAGSRCEHAWREQRPANDWKGFLVNWEPVVEHSRREAELLSQELGMGRYDALMEKFEPGVGSARVEALFSQTMLWLPALAAKARDAQASWRVVAPKGPFPAAAQRGMGLDAMRLLGFDFDRGRLDVSAHPFCGGVPSDVRITTVYDEADCVGGLMGVVHETGHALYEQGLPQEWAGLPAGRARSMGVHESQSLFHEMQLGGHPGFVGHVAGMLARHLGERDGFDADNVGMMARRVQPGLIRIKADELTYPAHVAMRFEIERGLIEGAFEARDVPAIWDERMMALLGQDTRGNFKDGPMQDIHWTDGSFGYFPSYTLGAMFAAQIFAAMRRDVPTVDADIGAGDLSGVRGWLREKVWSQGSLLSTPDLARHATGSDLDASFFRAHLESRYLGAAPAAQAKRAAAKL